MRHEISQERQDTFKRWCGENEEKHISSFYMERSYGYDGSTCSIANGDEGEIIEGLIGWLIIRVMKEHLSLDELMARITVCYYAKKRQQEETKEEAKEADNA